MEHVWQDVKFGLRMLIKSPGFALVAVLSLALGIGANSAMFSLVDAALLRDLPVERPEELVTVATRTSEGGMHYDFSYPLFTTLREINSDVLEIFAFTDGAFGISSGDQTERLMGEFVSANYFSTLGVRPLVGTGFAPTDEKAGAQPVAVISYSLWQRFFGGQADVIGKTLRVNNRVFTVVAVTPERFHGAIRGVNSQVWIPLPHYVELTNSSGILERKTTSWMRVAARLRPGVTAAQAQATVTSRLPAGFEKAIGPGQWAAAITPASTGDMAYSEPAQKPLYLLFAAVGLTLLIACANVANLLLARAHARQKEIGIRVALGATRTRLVRQLLTESVLLSLAGGALGLLLALWTTDVADFLRTATGVDILVTLDARVLGFTLAASILTAILFGIAPAVRAARVDLIPVLKGAAAMSGSHRMLPPMRHLLVVMQVSLSVVLLVGAGLFLRSLMKLQGVDTGFRAERVLAMSLDLELQGYDEGRGANFYPQLAERVASLPGTRAVSLASVLPATMGGRRMQRPGNQTRPPLNEPISIDLIAVTPRFFETIGLSLLRGRDFRTLDAQNSGKVAIVNETMASKFWPGQDPVGQTFFDGDESFEVVGVARNTKYRSLRESPRMTMYFPLAQDYRPRMTLLVATAGEPYDVQAAVRGTIRELDATFPVFNIRTLPEHVGRSLFLEKLQAYLLAAFGALALSLAGVGLYGVLAYTVAQRTREVGIRVALGAQRIDVLKLVVNQGLRLVLTGVALGIAGALALTRVVQSLLYGVRATDPVTFAGVALLLLGVAFGACVFPARRAARVDPIVALRYE